MNQSINTQAADKTMMESTLTLAMLREPDLELCTVCFRYLVHVYHVCIYMYIYPNNNGTPIPPAGVAAAVIGSCAVHALIAPTSPSPFRAISCDACFAVKIVT